MDKYPYKKWHLPYDFGYTIPINNQETEQGPSLVLEIDSSDLDDGTSFPEGLDDDNTNNNNAGRTSVSEVKKASKMLLTFQNNDFSSSQGLLNLNLNATCPLAADIFIGSISGTPDPEFNCNDQLDLKTLATVLTHVLDLPKMCSREGQQSYTPVTESGNFAHKSEAFISNVQRLAAIHNNPMSQSEQFLQLPETPSKLSLLTFQSFLNRFSKYSSPVIDPVNFNIDKLIHMTKDAERLAKRARTHGTFRTSTPRPLNSDFLNFFLVKNYIQELVIWSQCFDDVKEAFHSVYGILSTPETHSRDSDVFNLECGASNERSAVWISMFYLTKLNEAKAEINRLRLIIWLLLQASPDCLNGSRQLTARGIYADILDYLGVQKRSHESITERYFDSKNYVRYASYVTSFFVPGSQLQRIKGSSWLQRRVGCSNQGFGESVSEERAYEQAFMDLVHSICSRFVDFNTKQRETDAVADELNVALFAGLPTGKPIRNRSFWDLTKAVQTVTSSLSKNKHHIRLASMYKNLKEGIPSYSSATDVENVLVRRWLQSNSVSDGILMASIL